MKMTDKLKKGFLKNQAESNLMDEDVLITM